ncbi:flavodoxin [Ligilactobacillus apodemi]|uniref:Flavodoxin n=1 Tax=Ligilactobacillus apodemi DSM 16634 = JCM 16172 TaxID=1423724 RepID=A0A0R1TUZ7_9LACO|nr:flavodoxin [Ligilactobacillus apodemi]KRL85105.1 flavodoxin [Ligilactobacillus apodemi DSM 16634 = JCM 16172]MCR1902083.1 flavodoxin [Ligilactobacillus apodemi]
MATAKVIFATITGNNEDIADIIAQTLESEGLEVETEEISQADPTEFEEVDLCVVCPYTYDEGSLPDEGLDFFEELAETDLSGKIYGVAGSGDTFYGEYYGLAIDKFDQALAKAGATKGADNVKINLAPDSDEDIARLDEFAKKLAQKVQAN